MKVFIINECSCGSTGRIARDLLSLVKKNDGDGMLAVACSRTNMSTRAECIYIGNRITRNINLLFSSFTGYNSVLSIGSTLKLIKTIKKFQPDVIHLHNLHNSFLCLPLFFGYLKKAETKVIWTLHDCWAFTGQCPHFTMEKCDKWRDGCHKCKQFRQYPSSYMDRTKQMWKLKKKWFTGVDNMLIVTPSQWLAGLVRQSFLAEYPIKVINNGINLNVFKPVQSSFRKKYNIDRNKFILLGVSFGWNNKKGLDVFIELAKRLDGDKYQIILVGTDDIIDKQIPNSIVSIHRTQNQKELAEIYSSANLFINPTREENYPTVNMESIACGTPVVTFRTGGSPEILDSRTGRVVDYDDLDAMEREIIRICEEGGYFQMDCIQAAKKFDMNKKYEEYIELYEKGRIVD